MDTAKKFEQLEEMITSLLARLDDMKAENTDLKKTVRERDDRIEELQARLDTLNHDKEQINDKVSTLLSAIEDWEKGGRGEEPQSAAPAEDGDSGDSVTTGDDPADEAAEKNVSTGGDLFSMGG